jgi:hypothetical protein
MTRHRKGAKAMGRRQRRGRSKAVQRAASAGLQDAGPAAPAHRRLRGAIRHSPATRSYTVSDFHGIDQFVAASWSVAIPPIRQIHDDEVPDCKHCGAATEPMSKRSLESLRTISRCCAYCSRWLFTFP